MSSDFWAGYISGALGICVGNPLDIIKVQLQAGHHASILSSDASKIKGDTALLKGMSTLLLLSVTNLIKPFLEQVRQRPSWPMGHLTLFFL